VQLIQIPFSHNCIKVRRVLELKGLPFETLDISPMDRMPVRRVSGQPRVPVLVDGGRAIADSTAILLYLEETYPEPPLVPRDPRLRVECLVLEDWADAAFMALTRRLAYWNALRVPDAIESRFFPEARGLSRRARGIVARRALRRIFHLSESRNRRDEPEARRLARLAVERLDGGFLVGDSVTIADVTLAAMARPLRLAAPAVRDDPSVQALLAWSRSILGEASHAT
jgi:glutathione S-transferase